MRSRTPLVLIELLVMLMVFALASGLCVRAFVWAGITSEDNYSRDRAVLYAENAAQVIKSCNGDFEEASEILGAEDGSDGESFTLEITAGNGTMILKAEKTSGGGEKLLGTARITVAASGGEEIFAINTGWQEVSAHE